MTTKEEFFEAIVETKHLSLSGLVLSAKWSARDNL